MPAILRAECLRQGVAEDDVLMVDAPSTGVERIMGLVQSGDLALLLVHSERDKIFAMLGGAA